jgi:Flp pilus assembly protein TadB
MPVDDQKIGELIGTVAGLSQSFATMQQAQECSRVEVMDIFKEMRDNVKDLAANTTSAADRLAVSMAHHIADDNAVHSKVESIQQWRNSVSPQMDVLWDERNKTTGMLSASRLAAAAIWSVVTVVAGLIAGYVMQHKL